MRMIEDIDIDSWEQFHHQVYAKPLRLHILCCSTSISSTISGHKIRQEECQIYDNSELNLCTLCSTPVVLNRGAVR